METIEFALEGITPILMHSPQGMVAGGATGLGQKKIPTPEEEAERGAYRLLDGSLYMPAQAFRSALIDAGRGRRIGKAGASQTVGASAFLISEFCPLVDPDTGDALREYAVDVRRVVIQNNGIMRARPRIDKWATTLKLEYDPDFLNSSLLLELMGLAGRVVGVGDYRPRAPRGKGGHYGRFTAALV